MIYDHNLATRATLAVERIAGVLERMVPAPPPACECNALDDARQCPLWNHEQAKTSDTSPSAAASSSAPTSTPPGWSEEGGAEKSLGQVAHDAFWHEPGTYCNMDPSCRADWERSAQAVRAAVLAEVQRELTEDEYAEVYEAFDNGGEDASWPHVRAAVRKADALRSKRAGEK